MCVYRPYRCLCDPFSCCVLPDGITPGCLSATRRGVQLLGVLLCLLLLAATKPSSCYANSASEHRFQTCMVVLGTCEMSAPLCKGHWLCHYRPCPGFLRFLSLRFLRCLLVSLTSVLETVCPLLTSQSTALPGVCVLSSFPHFLYCLRSMVPFHVAWLPGCFPC